MGAVAFVHFVETALGRADGAGQLNAPSPADGLGFLRMAEIGWTLKAWHPRRQLPMGCLSTEINNAEPC